MGINIALYSHDSVGLGHARRNRALAWALAETLPRLTGQTTAGLLIAGHPDASQDSLPEGWDWLLLPGFARTPDGYAPRSMGVKSDQLTDLRSGIVAAALDSFSPDLFIVDRHPFGVDGELKPALQNLRDRHRCTTVLGMRDVLDTPSAVQQEWEQIGGGAEAARHYDALWVYGDAQAYDPLSTGEIPGEFADRSYFTGYLAHGRPEDTGRPVEAPYFLTMVGGGSDGGAIARAAAAAPVPAGHRHLIVTGPQMPEEDVDQVYAAVATNPDQSLLDGADGGSSAPRIRVLRSTANIPALIQHAAGVVCMGGYNSVAEVMATATPALVIPRSSRRAEQPRRAEALSSSGALETLPADQLTPERVGEWFRSARDRRVSRDHLELDGLRTVGQLAADLLGQAPERFPVPTLTAPADASSPAGESVRSRAPEVARVR
ncbi:glycosyltransferase family protein [Micrococcus terreus]|uniref:Predicted glycosyl transferase n=1 Tax=Micrococcus terreus TaxID=574650 RepID=A0A1I7MDZ4_9MICC|nr:glycosyltransferase [Micrococcus terreus]SFV20163.1 Predicted glycosyl transferase [Micrococcus terreus]